jgi:hypothetical protein
MGVRRGVVRRGLKRGDSTTFEAAGLGAVWCEPCRDSRVVTQAHDTGCVVIEWFIIVDTKLSLSDSTPTLPVYRSIQMSKTK